MANFTLEDVKTLRERLGTGMVDTKNALVEADGDLEKAVEILRLKGAKGNAKRADRSTAEGLVAAVVRGDGRAEPRPSTAGSPKRARASRRRRSAATASHAVSATSTAATGSTQVQAKLIAPSRQRPEAGRPKQELHREQCQTRQQQPGVELAVVAGLADPHLLALERIQLLHDPGERLGIGRAVVLAAAARREDAEQREEREEQDGTLHGEPPTWP